MSLRHQRASCNHDTYVLNFLYFKGVMRSVASRTRGEGEGARGRRGAAGDGAGCGRRTVAAARGSLAQSLAAGTAPAPPCQGRRPPGALVRCPACQRSRSDPSQGMALSSAEPPTSAEACDAAADICSQDTPSYVVFSAYLPH